MEQQVRQTLGERTGRVEGEEGVAQDLLAVRFVLRELPQACCPEGFEARLHRRIAGQVARPEQTRSAQNWVWGWAGAGLGFAAALVIAVVAFDFGFEGGSSVPMAGTAISQQPTEVSAPGSMAVEPKVAAPSSDGTGVTDQVAQKTGTEQLKDSNAAKAPTELPEGLYHMVGGNEGNNR